MHILVETIYSLRLVHKKPKMNENANSTNKWLLAKCKEKEEKKTHPPLTAVGLRRIYKD